MSIDGHEKTSLRMRLRSVHHGCATDGRVTAPDIPTFAESGVPGYDVESFYGLWAPARTPREFCPSANGRAGPIHSGCPRQRQGEAARVRNAYGEAVVASSGVPLER